MLHHCRRQSRKDDQPPDRSAWVNPERPKSLRRLCFADRMPCRLTSGCLCRFGKEYMHIISSKAFLKPQSNTAGPTPQEYKRTEDAPCIHNDILFCKLLYDTLCRYRIAKEQRYGVFIINEVAIGIGIGILRPTSTALL